MRIVVAVVAAGRAIAAVVALACGGGVLGVGIMLAAACVLGWFAL